MLNPACIICSTTIHRVITRFSALDLPRTSSLVMLNSPLVSSIAQHLITLSITRHSSFSLSFIYKNVLIVAKHRINHSVNGFIGHALLNSWICANLLHNHSYKLVVTLQRGLYLLLVCFVKIARFLKLQKNRAQGFHCVVINQQGVVPCR